ncbi:MAG: M24 family metallopeptidase [Arsenophonus sp.]
MTKTCDLVLVDLSGEYQGSISNITRTFPVNKKFSQPHP